MSVERTHLDQASAGGVGAGGVVAGGVVAGWFDEPTGLPGPAFWDAVLATEGARWTRYHRPSTVVLVEVVGLDQVGRAWGSDVAGRRVATVATTIRSDCRASDYLVRLDTTRFAILLSETDEIAAINMVERVRAACGRTLQGVAGDTSVAFGWASPTAHQTLLDAVDEARARLDRDAQADARR
jgi:diguanylate cyclase (GGDEF)-like protein